MLEVIIQTRNWYENSCTSINKSVRPEFLFEQIVPQKSTGKSVGPGASVCAIVSREESTQRYPAHSKEMASADDGCFPT